MINIIEAEPTKLSGITSLYISFDYNPEIVATIKLCDKYIYNNKNYTWEVPVTSLAFLLDELTYLDDITLKLKVEEENKGSLLDSITSAIDDLEDSTGGDVEPIVDLPIDTLIGVKSITFGGLTYKSKTNNAIFRWNQIGAVEYMTVGQLNEMNNYKTDFLRKPLVILLDERAIKKFRLTPVYENVAKINNLTAIFNSDIDAISKVIDDALRVNMRDILISKVRQMYKNKKLKDIEVIRLLEQKLQFDLSDAE